MTTTAVSVRPFVPAARRRGLGVAAALVLAAAAILAWAFTAGFGWARPAVLGALAAAAAFLAASRPRLYLYGVVSFLFVYGMVKGIYYQSVSVYFVQDIILGVLYLAWFIRYPLRRGWRGRYDKLATGVIGMFVGYSLLLTVSPFTNEPLILRLGGARWWLEFIPLFFVGADLLDTTGHFDRLCRLFVGAATVTGVYGIFQYVWGFEHLYPLSDRFREHAAWGIWTGDNIFAEANLRIRVFSTFDLATTFANMLRVAVLLAAGYAIHARKFVAGLAWVSALAVCFAALLLTGTRAAYAPLVIALAVYVVVEPRRKRMLPVLAALVVGFGAVMAMSARVYLYRVLLLVSDFNYTVARITWDWERAYDLVRDLPFGLGISTSAKTSAVIEDSIVAGGGGPTYRFIEHGFGQALVSLGWPGLALFAATFGVVAGRVAWRARRGRGEYWRTTLVFVLCVAELFPLLTHATLNFGLSPVIFWLTTGAVLALQRRGAPGLEEPAPDQRRRRRDHGYR